jgi:hypothetical protein
MIAEKLHIAYDFNHEFQRNLGFFLCVPFVCLLHSGFPKYLSLDLKRFTISARGAGILPGREFG